MIDQREIDAVREDNIRLSARIEQLEAALATAREDALREALAPVEYWISQFSDVEIKHTSAKDYATDAMRDVREAIADAIRTRTTQEGQL